LWFVGALILTMAMTGIRTGDEIEIIYFGVNLNAPVCSWNFDVYC